MRPFHRLLIRGGRYAEGDSWHLGADILPAVLMTDKSELWEGWEDIYYYLSDWHAIFLTQG